jgi:Dolichyl-phosphate-mannose-protein mannosyltransferase
MCPGPQAGEHADMQQNPLAAGPPAAGPQTPSQPDAPMPGSPGTSAADQPGARAGQPGTVATLGRRAQAQRPPWLGIGLIAAAAFAVQMTVSARYGYHRDELYFLAAGQHPAFGYVDQPPLTPLLARASAELFGNSLAGLRVLPALALSALVVLTAGMSRILGAGRTGQLVAALCTAACAEYLGAMHLLSTTTPDFVGWAVLLYLVLRLLDSGQPRWWIAIGVCAGISAEAKWMIFLLAATVLAGFALTPQRALLRSRYLLLGAALAAALTAPDLIWQAAHGWPDLAVFGNLHGAAGHNLAVYWPAQLAYTGLALTPVWVAGLVWALRNPRALRFRPAIIAAGLAILASFVLGGKPYYSGGAYTVLFAAGSVPVERWLTFKRDTGAGRRAPGRRIPWRPVAFTAGLVVTLALSLPVALPLLPARTLHTTQLQKINYDLGEQIAWPRLVQLVSREYHALPAAQRARTAILTGNYGEAGAVDRYGPGLGLPQAYSGHNNFWLWGPPPPADTSVLAVNVDRALLHRDFAQVRQVATFHNGLGVSDDEQGAPVYLATGLRGSWSHAWPAFRDYS